MQVTVDDLRRRYEAMPEEELAILAREGGMTEEADAVLRQVLAARQVELQPAWVASSSPPPTLLSLPSLPKVWPGYLIAAAFLVFEIAYWSAAEGLTLGLFLIGITGWIYWLWCVSRLHHVLAAVTYNRYPITPGSAVGRHFIPVYNFIWIFKWPSVLAEHLNGQGAQKAMAPVIPGLLLLMFSLLARFFDGAIGLTGIFATLGYIVRRVRPTVEVVQAVQEL